MTINDASMKKTQENVYCIVPGFLGNYSEGFTKRLYDYLSQDNRDVYPIKFHGHEPAEDVLSSPTQMIPHLSQEMIHITHHISLEHQKIVIIAHSQGCAITLATLIQKKILPKNAEIILLAPAVFLDKIIPPRISDTDLDHIKHTTSPVSCRVSQKYYKHIDQAWIDAYKNFSITEELKSIDYMCHIVYPQDEFLDHKNALTLKTLLPKNTYHTIDSNHFFDKNPNDISTLAQILNL